MVFMVMAVYLSSPPIKSLEQIGKEYKLSIDYTFTKVQDIHNLSLLQ